MDQKFKVILCYTVKKKKERKKRKKCICVSVCVCVCPSLRYMRLRLKKKKYIKIWGAFTSLVLLEVCRYRIEPAVLDSEELSTDGLWEILDAQASPVASRSSLPAVTTKP